MRMVFVGDVSTHVAHACVCMCAFVGVIYSIPILLL